MRRRIGSPLYVRASSTHSAMATRAGVAECSTSDMAQRRSARSIRASPVTGYCGARRVISASIESRCSISARDQLAGERRGIRVALFLGEMALQDRRRRCAGRSPPRRRRRAPDGDRSAGRGRGQPPTPSTSTVTAPMFAQYARAKPWVCTAPTSSARPATRSDERIYARDYNETRNLGGAKSTKRTADADRGGEVLDPGTISVRPGRRPRARFRPRRNWGSPRTRGCSRCSTWASRTPSSSIGTPSSPTTSGGRSRQSATVTGRQRRHRARRGLESLNATPMHPEYPVAGGHHRRAVRSAFFEAVFGPKPAIAGRGDRPHGPKLQAPIRQRPKLADEQSRTCASGAVSISATRWRSATTWARRSPPSWSTTRFGRRSERALSGYTRTRVPPRWRRPRSPRHRRRNRRDRRCP